MRFRLRDREWRTFLSRKMNEHTHTQHQAAHLKGQRFLQNHELQSDCVALSGNWDTHFLQCCQVRFVFRTPRLHLFDQKQSKNSNIVKYYFDLK